MEKDWKRFDGDEKGKQKRFRRWVLIPNTRRMICGQAMAELNQFSHHSQFRSFEQLFSQSANTIEIKQIYMHSILCAM